MQRAGLRQHVAGRVDRGDAVAARDQLFAQRAVAAAQVHDVAAVCGVDEVEHALAVLMDEGKAAGVALGVPGDVHTLILSNTLVPQRTPHARPSRIRNS